MSAPELVLDRWVAARANVNIALIKYWGKAAAATPDDVNLPAVPSLSLTLADLYTETRARFAPELDADEVTLDGRALGGEEQGRAVALLDALRARCGLASPFRIESRNFVPTAAGLASSASGMAALAAAAGGCAGLSAERDGKLLSEIARIGSGSASRSIFGGWVAWEGRHATPVAPIDHLPVAVVIAVIGTGRKSIGSRDAMNHTMRTSPFFAGWVQQAHATFDDALEALAQRDFPRLMAAMERSTWRMHASGMGADPPVFYWLPASVAVLAEVAAVKAEGVVCGATLDAGPNVKVFCLPEHARLIAERLAAVPGVAQIITSSPGAGIQVNIESNQQTGAPAASERDVPAAAPAGEVSR